MTALQAADGHLGFLRYLLAFDPLANLVLRSRLTLQPRSDTTAGRISIVTRLDIVNISKLKSVSVVVLAALLFAGCSSISVHQTGSVLTNASNLLAGKQVPMRKFTTQDVIRYYASFSWDDVTKSGGSHEVTWNWYKDDVLASTDTKHFVFDHAPYRLWTTRDAAALGIGKFRIDVLIDGQVGSSTTFEIQ